MANDGAGPVPFFWSTAVSKPTGKIGVRGNPIGKQGRPPTKYKPGTSAHQKRLRALEDAVMNTVPEKPQPPKVDGRRKITPTQLWRRYLAAAPAGIRSP